MSKVSLKGLKKAYGKTVALEHLNLELEQGSLVTLLGPSGCGKTTALRILAGLTKEDSGQVFFDSIDITKTSPADRDIGMVFQAYSLFPNMTARQNVEFGLRTRRVNKSEIESRVKKIFEIIELGSHIDRYPHQLSGGQQQRVALARAIVVRPKVLLLDEPLSALDAQVRDQLRDEIKRVQREFGITTLFVTHDQEEAMTISDRVGVMDKGRLLQIDTPQKVYAQPINPTVARFIGIMNEVPAVVSGNTVATLGSSFSLAQESSFASGSKNLKALIRPEAIEIIEPNHIGVPGKIISISFLGPIAMVQISLDRNLEIRAILPAAMINRYQVDQVVHVTSSAKSLIVAD